MKKIGLIAGGGVLPIEFVESAHLRGEKVIVLAFKDMASTELLEKADKVYWLKLGQSGKALFLLLKERLNRVALLGKVSRENIHKNTVYDRETREVFGAIKNKKDYSILKEVTRRLEKLGVKVIDPSEYLVHLIPEKGILTKGFLDEKLAGDMEFGYTTAKELAGMDIGQTIIVKDRTVVAAEAMEGTDATIERGRGIAGEGCVMVKVSRPGQDMRWDVPTVGPDTIKRLAVNKYRGIAIESGKMFLIHQKKCIQLAEEAGIAIKVF